MNYVCIENNQVVSVLNYAPHVPDSVTVVSISDTQAEQIMQGTHYFNVSSYEVNETPSTVKQALEQATQNVQARSYLNSTDWQVLRHMRQLHLGEPTSLTEDEYTQLERERARRAALIKS